MLILGVLLMGGGALLIVASVLTAEVTSSGKLELLNTEVGAVTLFLLGVGSGIAILWGMSITKFGAKRQLAQRRENQKLSELSEKLDRAEAERRRDLDGDDQDRPHI
ncbi:hypothetical protein NSZ01_12300 [Nocardioides szechwanensis]|uniref:Uncharacterized protein n=1 Tax=Nocardioides szechwanensis TaxID=1005944 RepID=A0A1H0CDE3_9ACTN|nr:hypothetical protein [Nocardioides szechwanensis]GEP33462.1 hypothetical protein NSZ01_12300 [Nocardioides szechwanensis]SDN55899.1 hypothetical protein SAMN05192576_2392 [Nocardioides szechwanensis]